MTISDLGSLGEFVSSFAVLATLAYLALQTRSARQATNLQTLMHIAGSMGSVSAGLLASDPDSLNVVARAKAGERLEGKSLTSYGEYINGLFVYSLGGLLEAGLVHHAKPCPGYV